MQKRMSVAGRSHHSGRRLFLTQARDAFAFLLVAFCIWAAVAQVTRRTFAPPSNAKTISEFAKTKEALVHLARVTVGSNEYYVWLGRTVWLAAPSGPACYVFDAHGNLMAYTATTGDGELGAYCDVASRTSSIELSEALNAVAGNRSRYKSRGPERETSQ